MSFSKRDCLGSFPPAPRCFIDYMIATNGRMPKLNFLLRAIFESGSLSALVVVATLVDGMVTASAQFFIFGGPPQSQPSVMGGFGGSGWFGGDGSPPFQDTPRYVRKRQPPRQTHVPRPNPVLKQLEDFSKAPPSEERETVPERKVLVLGDGMADWLAYGLEEAYADQPEMGVIRKIKPLSGLLKYQLKGDPGGWAALAKGLSATEKPDAIVVMLGLNDRISMRQPATENVGKKKTVSGKQVSKPGGVEPGDAKLGSAAKVLAEPDNVAAKVEDKADIESPSDDAAIDSNTSLALSPEKSSRSPDGVYEFRETGWVELYTKKINQLIGHMKSEGVPVLWVGLPAVRGTKATSDMLFLNSLYRDASGKAGITYVDVWDGFIDEADRFLQKGPDFDGQSRQLRSNDGVYFTKPGARKLAHYVEREITRLLAARSPSAAIPIDPASPNPIAPVNRPAARPLEGPILPLAMPSIISDRLLGGPDLHPTADDTLATRTLIRGEPLAPPAGRADDPAWPRREVGDERDQVATPTAKNSNDKTAIVIPETQRP